MTERTQVLPEAELPLQGLLVLDFSQFLSGPSAALRLADMGATVIKIERPQVGELCRQLYISALQLDGDSTLFHTINRNKRSYAADLKNPQHLQKLRQLIAKADVMIANFRPQVMERLGLDAASCHAINPGLVYGSVTGYGSTGPWVDLPGQDLLAQARSGLVWLNGDAEQGPVPVGLALADILTGSHLVQGILAALLRRGRTGKGAHVEVSLLESTLDFQFEVLTTHLNDGGQLPQRAAVRNAHAYLGAPYGIYSTADGELALAMGSLHTLAQALDCPALLPFADQGGDVAWRQRDDIKRLLAQHLRQHSTDHWLARLQALDYWCAPVMTWHELLQHEGFKTLDFLQTVQRDNGVQLRTTRCPIRVDGKVLKNGRGSPHVGEHNAWVEAQFGLNDKESQA
ncbi:CaiB/BaiF CoA transferase family protein [Roseateles sp. BYS180W]|uniref:CaiB/BaiF CoA transferase family protein n=1 Tax=Roseateles rivi TaxID=3299028 RepID=A0ABW7FWE6_9BURK